jgi:DNA-binding NarL/FixJ family response regulator
MMHDGVSEVLKALDEISADRVYVSTSLLPQLLKNFSIRKMEETVHEMNILSDRELEVFSLLGRGFGASQLARELHVSVKTIETHERRMKEKLALHTTAELRQKAARWILESARKNCNGA